MSAMLLQAGVLVFGVAAGVGLARLALDVFMTLAGSHLRRHG